MNRAQNYNQEGFQWGPFMLGILSIILAFFAFNHPVVSIVRKYNNNQFWFTVIIGILGVVIGFLLLNNPLSAYLTIAALVGIYFMVNGILNIVYAF